MQRQKKTGRIGGKGPRAVQTGRQVKFRGQGGQVAWVRALVLLLAQRVLPVALGS